MNEGETKKWESSTMSSSAPAPVTQPPQAAEPGPGAGGAELQLDQPSSDPQPALEPLGPAPPPVPAAGTRAAHAAATPGRDELPQWQGLPLRSGRGLTVTLLAMWAGKELRPTSVRHAVC
jgi:hypothetical protein